MLLDPKPVLERIGAELVQAREQLNAVPGLALVWVGEDKQTELFVKNKQKRAQELDCFFSLHRFPTGTERQLIALIDGLNNRKDIHGIVLQLPLPSHIDTEKVIERINPQKDVDGLLPGSVYPAPTPNGIVQLLQDNGVNLAEKKTVIIGAGRLVGAPLAELFNQQRWTHTQITRNAQSRFEEIAQADVLISCTGQVGLVTPEMVNRDMVVVDGSGVDVDVSLIEPLVASVTPKKGAVGPLTIANLYRNLLAAVAAR